MIGLIDGDAIIWVLAAVYKDHELNAAPEVEKAVANMVHDMLTIVGAYSFYGCLSDPDGSFRVQHYKYRKYKGNRPEKPEWFVKWNPIIRKKMNDLGFFQVAMMEADDIVAYIHETLCVDGEYGTIIMSEDKDLNQLPGPHFNYKKENATPIIITAAEANRNFWEQMLIGDSSDNVAGVPGLGEVKVKKLFSELDSFEIQCRSAVISAYCKYYDSYYGNIIFNETLIALKMMTREHPLFEDYKYLASDIPQSPSPIPVRESTDSVDYFAAAKIFG